MVLFHPLTVTARGASPRPLAAPVRPGPGDPQLQGRKSEQATGQKHRRACPQSPDPDPNHILPLAGRCTPPPSPAGALCAPSVALLLGARRRCSYKALNHMESLHIARKIQKLEIYSALCCGLYAKTPRTGHLVLDPSPPRGKGNKSGFGYQQSNPRNQLRLRCWKHTLQLWICCVWCQCVSDGFVVFRCNHHSFTA